MARPVFFGGGFLGLLLVLSVLGCGYGRAREEALRAELARRQAEQAQYQAQVARMEAERRAALAAHSAEAADEAAETTSAEAARDKAVAVKEVVDRYEAQRAADRQLQEALQKQLTLLRQELDETKAALATAKDELARLKKDGPQ